jgi:Protein of unknown function (DUF3800)
VYLLYLDESGTHAGAPVFVLAGLAIHENDVWYLQRALHRQVAAVLRPHSLDPTSFEVHANELRARDADLQARPTHGKRKAKPASPWLVIPEADRRSLLTNALRAVTAYRPQNARLPFRAFGAVVQATYANKEERAYELVLNKFDEMLGRLYHENGGERQRGLVLHDVRQKEEKGIQAWTSLWRERAGNVGKINNIVDVPVFLDSRASRVIQAADLVAYALWRYYSKSEERFIKPMWHLFDNDRGQMHGLIHVTPQFARAECNCTPCLNRLLPTT